MAREDGQAAGAPRLVTLANRPWVTHWLEVRCGDTGELIPSLRCTVRAPGITPRIHDGHQGRVGVVIPRGFPVNLFLEAPGHESVEVRQVTPGRLLQKNLTMSPTDME